MIVCERSAGRQTNVVLGIPTVLSFHLTAIATVYLPVHDSLYFRRLPWPPLLLWRDRSLFLTAGENKLPGNTLSCTEVASTSTIHPRPVCLFLRYISFVLVSEERLDLVSSLGFHHLPPCSHCVDLPVPMGHNFLSALPRRLKGSELASAALWSPPWHTCVGMTHGDPPLPLLKLGAAFLCGFNHPASTAAKVSFPFSANVIPCCHLPRISI